MDNNAKISKITVVAALSMWIIIAAIKLCIDLQKEVSTIKIRDYNEICTSQTLNVALTENATEYCIHNAIPRGFQLETLEDFCKVHGLELNIFPVNNELVAEALLTLVICNHCK